MSVLKDKRGTWINQYAEPAASQFLARTADVDYVAIKYGQETRDGRAFYESLAFSTGRPWVAELMPERGQAFAEEDGRHLGEQAAQPGCIAAIVNMEEADGSWQEDDGSRTSVFIDSFQAAAPGVELFASIDPRGNRPNSPYQLVLADRCAGVMPMIYPAAFYPTRFDGYVARAFADCLTPLLLQRWAGRDVIPTFQTYDAVSPDDITIEADQCRQLYDTGTIVGANSYTLGHASDAEWAASLAFAPHVQAPPAPVPAPGTDDYIAALHALRAAWTAQWRAIADVGTSPEASALAAWWAKLTS